MLYKCIFLLIIIIIIIIIWFLFIDKLGDDHLILRGGGRGGAGTFGRTDYLFLSRARPENLFPGKSRTEYLFSTATNFFKKEKKMGGV